MKSNSIAAWAALALAALACNLPGVPLRPTPTLRPSATFAPIGSGSQTATLPGGTSLPLLPTLTRAPTNTLPPTPTQKPVPHGTPPITGGMLTISAVSLVSVQRDASRPNGAIAKIRIDFNGGKPPYTYYEENVRQSGNPVDALTACGATLIHTVRVDSADGQTASKPYYFASITCPP